MNFPLEGKDNDGTSHTTYNLQEVFICLVSTEAVYSLCFCQITDPRVKFPYGVVSQCENRMTYPCPPSETRNDDCYAIIRLSICFPLATRKSILIKAMSLK